MPIQLSDPTTIISGLAALGAMFGGAFFSARVGQNGNSVRLKNIDRRTLEIHGRVEKILEQTNDLKVRMAVVETKIESGAG